MALKENLKDKIKIDRLLQNLLSTIREVPVHRRLDKVLAQELLDMTDFKYEKVRDLQLYVRPLDGAMMEVLVLDNELPIYHTTVDDVAMRKSPFRNEMFRISNIIKILFDKDVVISRGRESLNRIHAIALSLLDLTYNKNDLVPLIEDARQGLEEKSIRSDRGILRSVFLNCLISRRYLLGELSLDLQIFARPKPNSGPDPAYEHLILFDKEKLSLGLKMGSFSPQNDSDLAWVRRYSQGAEPADLHGIDVFGFLSELALERTQA